MPQAQSIEGYLQSLPSMEEIRRRITENARERRLLRQLLKLRDQRDRVQEVHK